MIEQNKPYSFEFQNFRRVHRNRAGGEIFAIELEVTEEEWHFLGQFPPDAIGQAAIQWTERAMREPKPPKEPTPYGTFWRKLDAKGFHNRPDVRRWVDCPHSAPETEAKEYLRRALQVEKRSISASPEMLLEYLQKASFMESAIDMVRRIQAEVAK